MRDVVFDDVKAWGMGFLQKHHWRIAGMCDYEDLKQECQFIFWRVKRKNPDLQGKDFLRVFQTALTFRLVDLSKDCFPNPYNVSEGKSVSHKVNAQYDRDMRILNGRVKFADYLYKSAKTAKDAVAALFEVGAVDVAKRELQAEYNREASQCTPGTGRCTSLTAEDGSDILERMSPLASTHEELEEGLDLMCGLPEDLKQVFAVLLQEALGVKSIPTLVRNRLRGRATQEPINLALCRLLGLDKSRDLLRELRSALKQGNQKKRTGMSKLETEILAVARVKRKSDEDEQDFLQRLVQKLDEVPEDVFFQMSEEARSWNDKATLAFTNGNEIPKIPDDGDDEVNEEDDDDLTDDQDDTENDSDSDEEEEDTSTKAKAKKAKAKAKTAKAKSSGKRGGAAPFQKKVHDDMIIRVNKTADERAKPGTKKHEQFQLYKDGMTVAKFLAKEGASRSNLLRDVRFKHISVEAPAE